MSVTLPRRVTMPRLVAVVLLALVATLLAPVSPAAIADTGAESDMVARINQARAAAGLPALTVAGDLTAVARRHSTVMRDAAELHHNPRLGSDVAGWRKVGENVGVGPSTSAVHDAFLASPGHRRNVLDPEFTEVGVGIVAVDGRLWITEVFRLPTGATTPAPAPAPTRTTAADPTPASSGPEPAAPRSSARPDRLALVLARLDGPTA